jgi:ABC-type transporter Mla subunit MlaD
MQNKGITVSGGSFTAGAVAAGTGARAIQNISAAADELDGGGRAEIAQHLRELRDAIAAQATHRDDAERLLRSAEDLAGEVSRAQPDRSRIRSLLDGITDAAGSVAGVATATAALSALL